MMGGAGFKTPKLEDSVGIAEFLLEKRKIELDYARPYMNPMVASRSVDDDEVIDNLETALDDIPQRERMMMKAEIREKYYEIYAEYAVI